ncbi:winged helix-turn-helix domain-containing protein [Paenibacillus sp. FSL H8-0104]|uniref:winged helix-turn-helix domain-containing protein n=1 Tax=Paenibacillus sp. FSL H8-0104 TaxID=2954509 RepID=UPI0030FD6F2D
MPDLIDRLFELYIIQNNHYLIQFKGGGYRTFSDRSKALRRYHLENHLKGKATIGTFSGEHFTKFMTFDVDFRDEAMAKWVTYKITAALVSVGIEDYAVSFSGGKGYHVDIFLNKAIHVQTSRRFFDHIVRIADLNNVSGGEVEYRPSGTQGVKLPIGTHQKTGKYCGFCLVEDGLRVMSPEESTEYIHAIQKTDHTLLLAVIQDEEDLARDIEAASEMETVISGHTMLDTYEQTESYTLSRAAERYNNGLTGPGQRHKSFLMLARLFNHNGVDRDSAVEAITEWFEWQDTKYYESDAEFCLKDLRECVNYVFDNNQTLSVEHRDITVRFGEIDEIMQRCPSMNHKALAYAVLIHSKRWAGETGAFYMSMKQMAEATGMNRTTVWRNLPTLENVGIIQVIQRDQKVRGTVEKKPNVYRMTLRDTEEESPVMDVSSGETLPQCLRFFYDEKQLRGILPRKQYSALVSAS